MTEIRQQLTVFTFLIRSRAFGLVVPDQMGVSLIPSLLGTGNENENENQLESTDWVKCYILQGNNIKRFRRSPTIDG